MSFEHFEYALKRYYKLNGKTKCYLQGKVFIPTGYDYPIYYRDVYRNKSRLWMDDGAFNIDHRVFDHLKERGIPEIHYFDKDQGKLYVTTTKKVENALERGDGRKERLHGHTQIFPPKYVWEEREKDYSSQRFIRREISV